MLYNLGKNPLPSVLLVKSNTQSVLATETLLANLRALPEVELAQLDLKWVQKLYSILQLARRITVALALALILAVLLIVGNTIRLAIENRRSEILVVKLVGATDAYVALPFLYTGAWYGIGGGLIAWLLLNVGLMWLKSPIAQLTGLYNSQFEPQGLNITASLLLLLTSGFIGWLGAYFSVKHHLRTIEPR